MDYDNDPDWQWKKKFIEDLESIKGPLSSEELDRILWPESYDGEGKLKEDPESLIPWDGADYPGEES
jgi:hypothetical protein